MYKKLTLNNGLRIVYENLPYYKSVSVGIWIGTGSRDENAENNGISHFIEHMLFKGTKSRTARDIAILIDSIGGRLNAFTGKENTCYYATVLNSHIKIAFDLLQDMVFNSLFKEEDISLEKQVVIEEINMYEDTPEEMVHEVLAKTVWDGNPLGYNIIGTRESVMGFNKDMIENYMNKNYTPSNTVIAVAGNFDENELIRLVDEYFSSWESNSLKKASYDYVNFTSDYKNIKKDTEQVHLCIGYEGIEIENDEIYTLMAVNNIFGGGMSSRLFQKIREEKGLVYSIYSLPSFYKNAGLFTIYAGMNPKQEKLVLDLILDEVKAILEKGIDKSELCKSKEQLKGSYILGLESANSQMANLGNSELLLGYVRTQEEVMDKIDKIDMDHIDKVLKEVFDLNKTGIAAVGPINGNIDFKGYFKR